jgi:hypothetical protein
MDPITPGVALELEKPLFWVFGKMLKNRAFFRIIVVTCPS